MGGDLEKELSHHVLCRHVLSFGIEMELSVIFAVAATLAKKRSCEVQSMFVIDGVVVVVVRAVPGVLCLCACPLSIESIFGDKLFLGDISTRRTAFQFLAPPAQTRGLVGGWLGRFCRPTRFAKNINLQKMH